jgi:hypothetical protein
VQRTCRGHATLPECSISRTLSCSSASADGGSSMLWSDGHFAPHAVQMALNTARLRGRARCTMKIPTHCHWQCNLVRYNRSMGRRLRQLRSESESELRRRTPFAQIPSAYHLLRCVRSALLFSFLAASVRSLAIVTAPSECLNWRCAPSFLLVVDCRAGYVSDSRGAAASEARPQAVSRCCPDAASPR